MSKVVVVGLTLREAAACSNPGELIVSPRTLNRLRGHNVDRVVFTASASRMNQTERINMSEAVLVCAETSATRQVVAAHLNAWCDYSSRFVQRTSRTPKPHDSGSVSPG